MASNKNYSEYIFKKTIPEDKRSFLERLISSLRVRFSIFQDKKTKKTEASVQITGGTDF